MKIVTFETPTMYGDHHVLEVRKLLLALPGVQRVYASSCFHLVQVTYDETALAHDTIRHTLEMAGYLRQVPVPTEREAAPMDEGEPTQFLRHTAVSQHGVRFVQDVPAAIRPWWPCPGIGTVSPEKEVPHG